MNETVEQTTKLLKELSILNKLDGRLLSDPGVVKRLMKDEKSGSSKLGKN